MIINNQEVNYIEYYSRWLFLGTLLLISVLIMTESANKKNKMKDKTGGFLQCFYFPPFIDFPKSNIYSMSIITITYPAFLIGITTGLLGIGGGVITVPLLIYGCGTTTNIAVGTSLLLVCFSTFYGTAVHTIRHNIDLRLVMILLIGSTIFAQIGAMATQIISGRSIRFYFSFIVWAIAALLLYDLATRFL